MANNTNLLKRLCALEAAHEPAFKGWRHVYSCDEQPDICAERGPECDSRTFMHPHPETGAWPPGSVLHTLADLERLQAEGWRIIRIRWTSNWRNDAEPIA